MPLQRNWNPITMLQQNTVRGVQLLSERAAI